MKNKPLYILFACVFLLTAFSSLFVGASATSDKTIADRELTTYLNKQDESNEIYNKLLQSFTQDGKYHLEENYPDYYAGAYIGENGNLVILTKNAQDADIVDLRQICGDGDYVIQSAKYSFNELLSAKKQISSLWAKACEKKLFEQQPFSVSIRDDYNKVFIGVADIEHKALLDYLTKDIDASMYELYESVAPQEMGNYYPGDYINGDTSGSAGYKAKLTISGEEKTGFITAGHVTGGSNIYTGWTHLIKIGNTIVEQNSGSVDAAFVELTGNNTFANQVEGYTITPGVSVIPAINSTVYKIGNSSDITSGTVISNMNESWWNVDGVPVKFINLCDTTVYCEDGDSGGLMYTKTGTTYKVIGNIKGGGGGIYSATKHSYLPWTLSIIS